MPRAFVAWLVAALSIVLAPRVAHAHALGVSNGEYAASGPDVVATLTFAKSELENAALDANAIVQRIAVTSNGAACAPSIDRVIATENDGLAIHARFRCPGAPANVRVALSFFDDLTHGHRHVAHAPNADDVLHRGHPDFTFTSPCPSPSPSATASGGSLARPSASAATSTATWTSALTFIRMGLEHILSGYDHLLFLFALVLVGGRTKELLAIVSAFTLAHSFTLALAALGVWAPSARVVEPAIALSIAYVGIENLVSRRPLRGRWKLTFAFGLVHGFGFAGALREIDLPRAKIPLALVSFNLGVELGQLAVLAALLPLLGLLRSRAGFAPRAVRMLSSAIVVLGVAWFIQRITAA